MVGREDVLGRRKEALSGNDAESGEVFCDNQQFSSTPRRFRSRKHRRATPAERIELVGESIKTSIFQYYGILTHW